MLLFSQNSRDYYVEIDSLHTFNILSKTINPDQTLTFDLDNNDLETFLNAQDIFSFEKAFPTAVTPILQRVYLVSLSDMNDINSFLERNEIVNVIEYEEPVLTSDYDLSTTYYPDDFIDYFEDFPNSELMLVRAPWAWTITKGDPNIYIGISDTKFDLNHEELLNKVVLNLNPGTHSKYHGTGSASVAAGDTGNGKGFASIGYNTRLVTQKKWE